MKSLRALLLVLAFASAAFCATDPKSDPAAEKKEAQRLAAFLDGLNYQKGTVPIINGRAQLNLGDKFAYLSGPDVRKVIVDLYHNPPNSGLPMGIIVPKDWKSDPFETWVAVIDWKEEGYVKDSDYDSLDFDKELAKLQENQRQASEERVRQGYSKLLIAGWAQPPHYDKVAHKIYWAKSIDVGGQIQQLDYDIDVLGRSGVLMVKIIDTMPNLAQIQAQAPSILSAIEFTDTNRYTDYKNGDKVAAYGIGGLIGVGLLAKAGFFKVLFAGLVAAWKFVVIGVAAIGSWLAKLFGRRKQL